MTATNIIASLKNEGDFVDVAIIDMAKYTAWKRAQGIPDDALGIPYGSRPDGMLRLIARSMAAARKLAAKHGATEIKEW